MHLRSTILRQGICQLMRILVSWIACKEARPRRTSRVYNCTFALRCARRLIIAATTSFGLHRIEIVSNRPADYLVGSIIIRTRNRCLAPCRKRPRQIVSFSSVISSCIVRTRMYSQFSEVRFSSVALAARNGQSSCPGGHSHGICSPTTSSNAFC